MPTDDKALREKLDAMIKKQPLEAEGHDSDCALRDAANYCSCGLVEYQTALDLLREKEERKTPCVWRWNSLRDLWRPECDGVSCEHRYDFCPGCGHPVQVKQKEDE